MLQDFPKILQDLLEISPRYRQAPYKMHKNSPGDPLEFSLRRNVKDPPRLFLPKIPEETPRSPQIPTRFPEDSPEMPPRSPDPPRTLYDRRFQVRLDVLLQAETSYKSSS
jgi:hypothetical protein